MKEWVMFREKWKCLKNHSGLKGSLWGVLILDLAVVVFFLFRLQEPLEALHGLALHAMGSRLLPWFLYSWGGMAFFSGLVFLRQGFGDEALVLFSLPLTGKIRFRGLMGAGMVEIVNLWLTAQVVWTLSLGVNHGVSGLLWSMIFFVGALFFLVLGPTICVFFLAGPEQPGRVFGGFCFMLALALGFYVLFSALKPGPMMLLTLGAVLVYMAWVMFAQFLGSLYEQAFYRYQGGVGKAPRRWLSQAFTRPLRNRSGLTTALFIRSLLHRSRHWSAWLAMGVVIAACIGFPYLRERLTPYGLSDPFLLIAFFTMGATFLAADSGSSPFGAEGNRLMLYLSAPLNSKTLLHAKLKAFYFLTLLACLVPALSLSLYLQLSGLECIQTLAGIVIIMGGVSVWLVSGSAWDINLDMEVGSGIQALLQEDAPANGKRLILAGSALFLTVFQLAVLWKLPPHLGLALLGLFNFLLFLGGRRFGENRLSYCIA